jgi:hypothetical protein
MQRLLLLFVVVIFVSCRQKNQNSQDKIELIKQHDHRITVDEWNGFAGFDSTFILNNHCINPYDCDEHYPKGAKPLTLYKVSYNQIPDSQNSNRKIFSPKDTAETPLTKQQSDRLFILTKLFLKSVDFNNYDTARNGTITKPYVTDDSQVKVELNYGGRSLTAYVSSINNPTIGTTQLDTLLGFLYSFKQNK